jgi:hypothetical protein
VVRACNATHDAECAPLPSASRSSSSSTGGITAIIVVIVVLLIIVLAVIAAVYYRRKTGALQAKVKEMDAAAKQAAGPPKTVGGLGNTHYMHGTAFLNPLYAEAEDGGAGAGGDRSTVLSNPLYDNGEDFGDYADFQAEGQDAYNEPAVLYDAPSFPGSADDTYGTNEGGYLDVNDIDGNDEGGYLDVHATPEFE